MAKYAGKTIKDGIYYCYCHSILKDHNLKMQWTRENDYNVLQIKTIMSFNECDK